MHHMLWCLALAAMSCRGGSEWAVNEQGSRSQSDAFQKVSQLEQAAKEEGAFRIRLAPMSHIAKSPLNPHLHLQITPAPNGPARGSCSSGPPPLSVRRDL